MLPDVSRETAEKLEHYYQLLIKWQKAINLVSPQSLKEVEKRHFADSAQLAAFVPDNCRTLADLGSGAGFPGLVLAVLRPEIGVHLVESDERKCEFLRTVSRETGAGAIVHAKRIEEVYEDIRPDAVTARALASMAELCGYCLPWARANPALALLFLKGERAGEEIKEAQKTYVFEHVLTPSDTDRAAAIVRLSNLSCV